MNTQTFSFKQYPVSFRDDAYLNATSVAAHFGKRARDYLANEQTENYIKALTDCFCLKAGNPAFNKKQWVIVKRGAPEAGGGTWLHPKLAVDFARWLSPEFAVWCDAQIEEILGINKQQSPTPTTPDERAGLRAAVTMLTTKRGLMHDEAYRLVHQRFNVGSIDELTHEQLPQAVEYVHRLALTGELLPKEDKTDERAAYVRGQRVCAVALMTTGYLRWREQEAALNRLQDDALKAMDLLDAVLRRSHAILGSGGAVYDGLYEAQGRLGFPREVLDEGRAMAEQRYHPRISV